jgi:NadR type nicotinamide-nucleotide adenylyltransferase
LSAVRRVRRLVVTGSESTGKTTLAGELAKQLGGVVCPEFAREYADTKGAPLDRHDVEAIAMGQIGREDRVAAGLPAIMVLDTDLFSTAVYGPEYYGELAPWIEREALHRRGDLYLLMDIDVPWVPDPRRDRGHRRHEVHALFRAILEKHGLAYVTISGSWDDRRERAVAACEAAGRAG